MIARRGTYIAIPMGTARNGKGGQFKLEHVLIAEKALGHPLPKGAVVHHVDENPSNNANTNLVICQDRKYHRLLHRRMDLLKNKRL